VRFPAWRKSASRLTTLPHAAREISTSIMPPQRMLPPSPPSPLTSLRPRTLHRVPQPEFQYQICCWVTVRQANIFLLIVQTHKHNYLPPSPPPLLFHARCCLPRDSDPRTMHTGSRAFRPGPWRNAKVVLVTSDACQGGIKAPFCADFDQEKKTIYLSHEVSTWVDLKKFGACRRATSGRPTRHIHP